MKTKYDAVIIADGLFPTGEMVLDMIRNSEKIICCDGATRKALDNGFTPDYIVGDLDSLDSRLKHQFSDRLHHIPDQDTNDLTKSVNFTVGLGAKNVLIVGATGLREDHTLGNISLLLGYTGLFDNVEMISDYGWFTAMTTTTEFTAYSGQQVSLFSLTPETPVSTRGLKYEVTGRRFLSWWEGTLNEAISDTFTIELTSPGRLIVYRAF